MKLSLVAVFASLSLLGCSDPPEMERLDPSARSLGGETAIDPAPKIKRDAHVMRDLDKGPAHHVTYRPADVPWRAGPASFEEGAQFAVLEGDPAAPGVFTMQLKLPDGFVINPHWHPNVERVTVLEGTFLLGSGDKVDREAAARMPPGTYTSMPPEMVHHAIAEGETIVQLTSVGPWEINYVHPKHDPRTRS